MFRDLLVATTNEGKLKEISGLLHGHGVAIKSLQEYVIKAPEETGTSFLENAILKADYYQQLTKIPTIAEDSGLLIPAIGNFPGLRSARFLAEHDTANAAFHELAKMIGNQSMNARFFCALAFIDKDEKLHSFEGMVSGHLVFPPRGKNGFGYDPIFVPTGYNHTFAEMPHEEKSGISHRAIAFNKFIHHLNEHEF